MRETLLSIHVLAVIVWLGAGFYELWLGRLFLRSDGSAAEATLIRTIYRSDVVVFAATLIAFAAGVTMALTLGWGFFQELWLGVKQAIMIAVLVIVAAIFPAALKLGRQISALPAGDGAVPAELKTTYARLEPWYWVMRLLGVAAVLLAIWRPV